MIDLGVAERQAIALPRMLATNANVVGISLGNLPPCRYGQRMLAILSNGAIIDLVKMQRHVQIGAVALKGVSEGVGLIGGVRCDRESG